MVTLEDQDEKRAKQPGHLRGSRSLAPSSARRTEGSRAGRSEKDFAHPPPPPGQWEGGGKGVARRREHRAEIENTASTGRVTPESKKSREERRADEEKETPGPPRLPSASNPPKAPLSLPLAELPLKRSPDPASLAETTSSCFNINEKADGVA